MTWWILIADAARAKIFSTKGAGRPLHLEQSLDNPSGRAATHELVDGQPGRYSKGGKGGTLSAFEPDTPRHVIEEERFAQKLAELLQTALTQKKFDSLAILAPAKFLGILRQTINPQVQKHLAASLAKDLAALNERELPSHLAEIFLPSS
jgi:protein required for attachment to host cells